MFVRALLCSQTETMSWQCCHLCIYLCVWYKTLWGRSRLLIALNTAVMLVVLKEFKVAVYVSVRCLNLNLYAITVWVSWSMAQAEGQIMPGKTWCINHRTTFTLIQWFLSLLLSTAGFLSYQKLFAIHNTFLMRMFIMNMAGLIQHPETTPWPDLWTWWPILQNSTAPAFSIPIVHYQCTTTRWQQKIMFREKMQFRGQISSVCCVM